MNDLFEAAKETCHKFGLTWYHPVTGKAYPPPKPEPKEKKNGNPAA